MVFDLVSLVYIKAMYSSLIETGKVLFLFGWKIFMPEVGWLAFNAAETFLACDWSVFVGRCNLIGCRRSGGRLTAGV